jgi:hypothetical protein
MADQDLPQDALGYPGTVHGSAGAVTTGAGLGADPAAITGDQLSSRARPNAVAPYCFLPTTVRQVLPNGSVVSHLSTNPKPYLMKASASSASVMDRRYRTRASP